MSKGTSIEVWTYSTPRYRSLRFWREARKPGIAAGPDPARSELRFDDRTSSLNLSGLSLTLSEGLPRLEPIGKPVALALKRAMDIVVSLFALAVLLPFFPLLAIAIKASSPGPVLFRQTRVGLAGRPITIWKFRSMRDGPHERSGTEAAEMRVTSIGRFMRRSNIDELPQFINILKGEMSLVGPRPHIFGMFAAGMPYEELVPYYHLRQAMKPGLSGWAQVNGYRGHTGDGARARARIDHDLAYIENFSLLLDLKVIGMTLIRETLGGTGS